MALFGLNFSSKKNAKSATTSKGSGSGAGRSAEDFGTFKIVMNGFDKIQVNAKIHELKKQITSLEDDKNKLKVELDKFSGEIDYTIKIRQLEDSLSLEEEDGRRKKLIIEDLNRENTSLKSELDELKVALSAPQDISALSMPDVVAAPSLSVVEESQQIEEEFENIPEPKKTQEDNMSFLDAFEEEGKQFVEEDVVQPSPKQEETKSEPEDDFGGFFDTTALDDGENKEAEPIQGEDEGFGEFVTKENPKNSLDNTGEDDFGNFGFGAELGEEKENPKTDFGLDFGSFNFETETPEKVNNAVIAETGDDNEFYDNALSLDDLKSLSFDNDDDDYADLFKSDNPAMQAVQKEETSVQEDLIFSNEETKSQSYEEFSFEEDIVLEESVAMEISAPTTSAPAEPKPTPTLVEPTQIPVLPPVQKVEEPQDIIDSDDLSDLFGEVQMFEPVAVPESKPPAAQKVAQEENVGDNSEFASLMFDENDPSPLPAANHQPENIPVPPPQQQTPMPPQMQIPPQQNPADPYGIGQPNPYGTQPNPYGMQNPYGIPNLYGMPNGIPSPYGMPNPYAPQGFGMSPYGVPPMPGYNPFAVPPAPNAPEQPKTDKTTNDLDDGALLFDAEGNLISFATATNHPSQKLNSKKRPEQKYPSIAAGMGKPQLAGQYNKPSKGLKGIVSSVDKNKNNDD